VLHTFVTFEAEFPDDAVFDSRGDIEVPGGKNVAQAIVESLRTRGTDVTQPVQHSYYGWKFMACAGSESFDLVLQYPGPWLLLSQRVESLMDKLRHPKSEDTHRKILEEVSTILGQDRRFRRQSWFTKEEYESDVSRPRRDKP
jgi:hypothetical protein